MAEPLPHATCSDADTDLSALHALLDARIMSFSQEMLGWTWTNRIGSLTEAEGKIFGVVSPIDQRVMLGSFHTADAESVDRAVQGARAAFDPWRQQPWPERVAVFRRLAAELERLKYDLAIASLLEVGKSRMEALAEADEAIGLVRHYCDQAEANDGFVRKPDGGGRQEPGVDMLRPFGAFAVIASFNTPLASAMNMLAAALLAGNTVVFKPSGSAGLTSLMLADAALRAGVPLGVLNVICGGSETGRALAQHAGIDGIAFTGARAIGMEILRAAAAERFPHPAIVAIGGKNPAYVTASADLDLAAEGVMRSAFGLQGQKRSATSKVYVHSDVRDAFVGKLLRLTAGIRVGDPTNAAVFMGPLIDDAALARFQEAVEEARACGTVLTGGDRLTGGLYDHGAYVSPTVIEGVPAAHRLNKEELFLPLLSVLPFTDLATAITDGNDGTDGPVAGCYAADEAELALFMDSAKGRFLYANGRTGATTGTGLDSHVHDRKGADGTANGDVIPYDLPQFMRRQRRIGGRGG